MMIIYNRITYIVLLSDICLWVGGQFLPNGDGWAYFSEKKGQTRMRLTLSKTYCVHRTSEVTQMFFLLYRGRIMGLGGKKKKIKQFSRQGERWRFIQMARAGQIFIVH